MKKAPGRGTTETALVPFGDMLNHSPHPNLRHTRWTFVHNNTATTSLVNDDSDAASDTTPMPSTTRKLCKGWFVLTVASESGLPVPKSEAEAGGLGTTDGNVIDCTQDQEVFDSYGHKSNSRYLLNYGFAIQQNIITSSSNGSKNCSNDITSAGAAPANASHSHSTLRCFEDCRLFFQLDPMDPHLTLKVQLDDTTTSALLLVTHNSLTLALHMLNIYVVIITDVIISVCCSPAIKIPLPRGNNSTSSRWHQQRWVAGVG